MLCKNVQGIGLKLKKASHASVCSFCFFFYNVDTLVHVVWITVSLGLPDGLKPVPVASEENKLLKGSVVTLVLWCSFPTLRAGEWQQAGAALSTVMVSFVFQAADPDPGALQSQ